ncbi:MAG: hypothetical protein LBF87_08000 [Treponema sp.]|jgi:hypothetical protein|nr:hypothetical protein [Treponema sp.]
MYIAIVLSSASLLSCICFFLYCRHYIKSRTGEHLLAEYREEVQKLIAELDAATDRDERLVTERITGLKTLMEKVDKRLRVLIGEEERRRVHAETYAELGRRRPVSPSAALTVETQPLPLVSDTPVSETPVSDTTPAMPQAPRVMIAEQQIEPAPLPVAERVAQLSKAGLSADLIAASLKVSIAEVELVMAFVGQ